MGAREKLNVWNSVGCLGLAGLLGIVFQSGWVFLVALVLLVLAGIQAGSIRPQGPRR